MSEAANDDIRTLDACVRLLELQLRELEERLRRAEEELKALREEVARVRPIRIEAINYKVQELVVSELSGTLHVGLTALTDTKSLEKIVGGGEAVELENLTNEGGEQADGG